MYAFWICKPVDFWLHLEPTSFPSHSSFQIMWEMLKKWDCQNRADEQNKQSCCKLNLTHFLYSVQPGQLTHTQQERAAPQPPCLPSSPSAWPGSTHQAVLLRNKHFLTPFYFRTDVKLLKPWVSTRCMHEAVAEAGANWSCISLGTLSEDALYR